VCARAHTEETEWKEGGILTSAFWSNKMYKIVDCDIISSFLPRIRPSE